MSEPRVSTFWLSMHAGYACRHSGACCSSAWAIPVERDRVDAIQALRPDRAWLLPAPGAPPDVAGMLAYSHGGRCVFHRDGCEIHHAHGHAALPSACRHFPREVLLDSRGVFVTLSHYCPTAAALLFEHSGPVEIVRGPAAVPEGEPEGLDARDVLPPLLTAGVLMDYAGYSAWEAHMVRTLTAGVDRAPEAALTLLDHHACALQQWRPGKTSLADAVGNLGDDIAIENAPPAFLPAEFFPVVNRFLAAHAFASWMAYQGNGLASVLRALHHTLTALQQEVMKVCDAERGPLTVARLKHAIRQTDLRVVHLRDG